MSPTVPEMSVEILHAELQSENPPLIVDVREDWEWKQGHIADAVHVPLHELPTRLLTLDATKHVAFICHLGGRSEMATRYALQNGFAQSSNVVGGMDAWEKRGYPTAS